MKNLKKNAVALVALIALTGCVGQGAISVAAIRGPLRRVMERHDGYVKEDAGLSELQRRTQLRSTELLERVLQEAEKAAK